MSKLILFLSFISLVVIAIGSNFLAGNPAFWLASSSALFQQMRLVLAVIIAVQIMTKPPRRVWFRIIAGVTGVSAAVWTIQQTYGYQMQLLDTLTFMGAAFAITAAALERKVRTIIIPVTSIS